MTTSLGNIGQWTSGGTPSRANPAYYGGGIPWVKTGELQDGWLVQTEEFLTEAGVKSSTAQILPKGTLLVAMYGATIGKLGILGLEAATNQACAALLANGATADVIPFVFHYLRSQRENLKRLGQGGAQPNISQAVLKNFPCVMPPLPEQRRIVSKIEALTARRRRAKEALDAIPTLIERFRQAVLTSAFRGDLTAAWREKHKDVEPAEVLMQRIRNERRKKWRKSKYEEPVAANVTELPKLPQGWVWARAEEVCEIITKGTTPSADKLLAKDGDVPFIKVHNLTFGGHLDLSISATFISDETHREELARSRVFPGDILMNIVGPPLGKVALVPASYPEWNINQAIALYRPIFGLDPHFMCSYLLWNATTARLARRAKATAGQWNLTLEVCRDLPVPLAPLAEQELIARTVRAAFQRCARIEGLTATLGSEVERLDRVILSKAFRGELVPQDPTDERASAFLERISISFCST